MRKLGVFLSALACWVGMAAHASAQFYPNPGGTPIPPGIPPGPYMPGTNHLPIPTPPNPVERPNAWTEEEFNVVAPVRWHIGTDYISFFTKSITLPAVLTRGSVFDAVPGALGQPNTTVLVGGDYNLSQLNGFRTTITYWLADPEQVSIDGNFLFSEQRRRQFTNQLNATGTDVVARPFFNINPDGQSAFPILVSNAGLAPVGGVTTDSLTQQIMGSEVNLKANLSGGGYKSGHSFIVLAGTRWLFLHEAYENSDFTQAGTVSTQTSDRFVTDNRFFGGQAGVQYRGRLDRFTVDLFGKAALGVLQQRLQIAGTTFAIDPATGTQNFLPNVGNYVVPSNAGVFNRNRFSVLPEFGINLGFDITDGLHVNVGYSMLFMYRVLRPGDQIDPNFNFNTFAQPIPLFKETDFWVGMLNAGLEWRF